MTDARQRAALAERAARAGGAVARDAFRGGLEVETKGDKTDLVTDADYETQRQVVHTITQEFPAEPFVCEETIPETEGTGPTDANPGEQLDSVPESGPCWVVDPIDGTANFTRGLRLWCTAVAAVRDDETVAAATYLPAVQDIYTAGPDSATRNGDTLVVSDRSDPETFATALVARWADDRSDRLGSLVSGINERFGDPRRFGSFQASLAFLASGELDAAVTTEPFTPWDTLAGVHLVRQAGGTVTGIDGDTWTLASEGLVASNGEAHAEIVETVSESLDAEVS
jgi:myo-inositol-1(or 4)-monophosphatase